MKHALLRIERSVWSFGPVRLLISALDATARRLLWLWGRARFGALVPHRGEGCVCHWNADLKYPQNLRLGDGVVIGVDVALGAHSPIRIGHRVRISKEVVIETAGLDFSALTPPYTHTSAPIDIGEGVWIGTRAMILGGVSIGEFSIVAAGAVVTKSMPARSIVAGIPARVIATIKTQDEPEDA